MKIEYDPIHDLLNIEFVQDEAIDESVEVDGIIKLATMDGISFLTPLAAHQ